MEDAGRWERWEEDVGETEERKDPCDGEKMLDEVNGKLTIIFLIIQSPDFSFYQ